MSETGQSVLFADNDRLLREAIGDFLRAKGFEVRLAADGLEALDMVRQSVPDFLVLDIVMPKISGARVCRLIRENPDLRGIPIIAFTALSAHDFRWFPELSPDAYVAKGPLPVACENLLRALADIRKLRAGPISDAILGYRHFEPHPLVREIFEERQRLLDLLDAVGRGVVELDAEGRILRATPDACKLLDRRELDLIGERFVGLWAPQDHEPLQGLVDEAGKTPEARTFRLRVTLNGREVRLLVTGMRGAGRPPGLAVTFEAEAP
jgi:two-component system, cell cycle response regulator DivK